jgi:uncharacterized protein (TIGR02266 family)
MARGERRKYPRVPLNLLIQYRFDSFEDFISEYASDISEGGMFIRTLEPREEGTMLYLQLVLRDGSKLIEGLGRVVRVNPPSTHADHSPGMGIEFLSLDEESAALINEIVTQNVAHRAGRPPK